MYPVNRGLNSYPYQRPQMPANQYSHPNWEAVSSQMKEPWPNHYGYPVPMQCHNCCSHGQSPTYYDFRPPCSHFVPPPSPAYNHLCGGPGGFPPYPPQSHPVYYAPPPHYSMELPRYEYEKNVPQDQFHCCGCPNHRCNVKGRNNVKIEEQEPDVETKKSESLFPAGAHNYSYPFMWIPPGYTMNKEQPSRLVENEVNEQQVLPYQKKPQEQWRPTETEGQEFEGSLNGRKPHNQSAQLAEQDPNSRYGWFPLDLSNIKKLIEGGDARQTHDQENRIRDENTGRDVEKNDQNKNFSYPIIWMPYNEPMDNDSKAQEDKTAATAEEAPSFKVVPRKLEHTDDKPEKGRTAGDDDSRVATQGGDKKKIVKTIPVKQVDECKVDQAAVSDASLDSAKNGTSKQPSSPTKKSMLPPICLRVDPPKKRNGNGSLRSPSPPGDKNKQPHKEIKVKDAETPSQNKIEVSQDAGDAKKGADILKDKAAYAEKKVVEQADSDKLGDAKSGDDSLKPQEPQRAMEGEFQQESMKKRKVMSEMEAAVIIQSAYRGYGVRRSEQLKKLKQIAKIHEEAIKVKQHIEDLESRAAVDYKEKATIGEIIMNLLLKLDSIQGLHQSIRDVRRTVAKELILLQEKLDSIVSQKSTTVQAAEESPKKSGLVEGSEGIVESLKEPSQDSSLDRDDRTKVSEKDGIGSNDLSSSQPCHDGMCGSENNKTLREEVVKMESQKGPQDEFVVSSPSNGGVTGLGSEMKENHVCESSQQKSPTEIKKSLVNGSPIEKSPAPIDLVSRNKDQEENLLFEPPQEAVTNLASAAPVEDIAVQKDQKESRLPELPQEVGEDFLANVSTVEDTIVQDDAVATNGNKGQEEDTRSELPREVVEDDKKEIPLTKCGLDSSKFALPSEEQPNQDGGSDTLSELPRQVVEDDEKEIPLTECGLHSSRFAPPSEEQPNQDGGSVSEVERVELETDLQFNLPIEVINDDGKEPTDIDTSGILNINLEEDQPNERIAVGNEDNVVIEHENHELSKDTLSGQEAETVLSPTNIELPVMEEVQSKLPESTGESEVTVEAPPIENKDEVMKESSEKSNVECTSRTTPLEDSSCNNEDNDKKNASETVKQELPIGTLLPETDVQQSKEGHGANDEQIDKKIIEENEKLKQLLEKLLASGKEQQEVISNLNGKVKDLEKKLSRKKVKSPKHPRFKVSRRLANGSVGERPMGIAS